MSQSHAGKSRLRSKTSIESFLSLSGWTLIDQRVNAELVKRTHAHMQVQLPHYRIVG